MLQRRQTPTVSTQRRNRAEFLMLARKSRQPRSRAVATHARSSQRRTPRWYIDGNVLLLWLGTITSVDRREYRKLPGCTEFMPLPFYLFLDRNPDIAASSSAHSPTCLPDSLVCARPMSRFPVSSRVVSPSAGCAFSSSPSRSQGTLSPLHAEPPRTISSKANRPKFAKITSTPIRIIDKPGWQSPRTWNTRSPITRLRFQAASNTSTWAESCAIKAS